MSPSLLVTGDVSLGNEKLQRGKRSKGSEIQCYFLGTHILDAVGEMPKKEGG